MYSFPAYLLRVNFIYQFKTKNIFLTVGDDEDMTPLIRLVSLSLSTHMLIVFSLDIECGMLISVIKMALLLLLVLSELSSLELSNNVR